MNISRFLYFFFLLIISLPLSSLAQSDANQTEDWQLMTDRPFYVLGEEVWFQVFCAGQPISRVPSAIVHLEWIDPEGRVLRHQKISITQGHGSGNLAIPKEWTNGVYRMRLYSHWNLNFEPTPTTVLEIPIFALPDARALATLQAGIDTISEKEFRVPMAESTGSIEIEVPAQTHLPRQSIPCTIRFANDASPANFLQLLVQVNQAGSGLVSQQSPKSLAPARRKTAADIPPETLLHQHLKIRTGDNQPLSTGFLEAIVLETGQLFYGTSVNGIAKITTAGLVGPSTLEFFDVNPFELRTSLKVEVAPEILPVPKLGPIGKQPEVTPAVARYLIAKTEQRAIEGLFGPEAAFSPEPIQLEEVSRPVVQDFNLGQYLQFEDLFHFTKEAVLSCVVRTDKKGNGLGDKKTNRYLYVRTFSETGAEEPPELRQNRPTLYGINGYFTYDVDMVLAQAWNDVAIMEIYNIRESLQKYFGLAGKAGVINWETKDGRTPKELREAPHFVQVEGVVGNREFPVTPPPAASESESSLPDFRPTIFWKPDYFLPAAESANLSIVLGDAPGWYRILVRGITDQGKLVEGEKWVQVGWKE